jgi:hypothetical protein
LPRLSSRERPRPAGLFLEEEAAEGWWWGHLAVTDV